MDTTEILEEAAATRPFQRLLAGPGPIRVAEVPMPGHGFVAAVLAYILEAPVPTIGVFQSGKRAVRVSH